MLYIPLDNYCYFEGHCYFPL